MPGQVQKKKSQQDTAVEQDVAKAAGAEPSKVDSDKLKSDLDDLLDEIEGVLEENAQEFVAGFIQKGGE
jgi:ubiquitin-like protein Pup